jgi:FkbM family methyltransferase
MVDERLIYDVGAHQGEDTEFYLKKGFRVVAIEAVPEFCARLRERFPEAVRDGRLAILNVAVSRAAGTTDFYVDEAHSHFGTANLEWVKRNRLLGAGRTRRISVAARSLADIFEEHGVPRYCKIDIEGNDLDALKSLAGSIEVPPYLSIESEKRDWSLLLEEFKTFRVLGYSRYQIVDQTLIEVLQAAPRPAREGCDCDHVFQPGSSGLFGEELPGMWLALPEAIAACRQIFCGHALNGDYGLFTRKLGIFRTLGRIQAMTTQLKNLTGFVTAASVLPWPAWYDIHAAR